jgi:hypothetical protein
MPSSLARWRAEGETGCRAAMADGAGSGTGAAATASPGSRKVASTVPTGTFSPGATFSSQTVPSCQISTSTAALEVSTTATT